MTAVAVSSRARKLRARRRAAPSPQALGVNLSSAPRRGRQEQLPARSRAAQAGGEDRGRTRSVSAREPAGKGRRNWARRAAARPRASCGSGSSKGGGAAAPPAVLRTTKVAWQLGQKAQNGRDASSRRPPARLALEDPKSSSAASTRASRSAAGRHRPPLRLRRPRRARTSSCDPAPQPRVPSAEWGALGYSSVFQGCPRRPSNTAGAAATVAPICGHREVRRPSERAAGLLPRPVSGSQLVAERRSGVGIPEVIVGNYAGPSARSPSGTALPPRRCAASPGGQRSGASKDSRAGCEAADAWGVRLGRAGPRRLRGKFSRQREGWRPGREQPRCSWAGPGRQRKAPERSDSLAAGKGAPPLGGVAAGGGGRSGGGLMAKC